MKGMGTASAFMAAIVVKNLVKKVSRTRKAFASTNLGSNRSSQRSCEERYFTGNDKVELKPEQRNDLASIQLQILRDFGDPSVLEK